MGLPYNRTSAKNFGRFASGTLTAITSLIMDLILVFAGIIIIALKQETMHLPGIMPSLMPASTSKLTKDIS